MEEYYCRLCETKHPIATYDIICSTCNSRYCSLSIKSAIDEEQYDCTYCLEKLIDTYGTTSLVPTEANALQELENQIGKSIPKVKRINEDIFGFMTWKNRVIGQGLHKQELRYFPENLFNLRNLKRLNLSFNQLTSLPETLGQLNNLQELYLSYNMLKSLPETLGELTNLQTLNLTRNQLTSLPETLGNLTKLRALRLTRNQLTSLPETLGKLTNLRTLGLGKNQLRPLPETLTTWLDTLKERGCIVTKLSAFQ